MNNVLQAAIMGVSISLSTSISQCAGVWRHDGSGIG